MKIVIMFFFFFSFLLGNEVKIVKKYILDKNNSITIEQLIKNKNSFQSIEKYNLGSVKENIWLHIPLKNISKNIIETRLHNKRAGLDFIDVFIVKNNKVIKTYSLGDMREYTNRDNIFRVSYFDVKLLVSEEVDIFIKQRSYGSVDIRWHIDSIESFDNYYNKQSIVYAFITGMLIVTILATIMLFFFLKNKFYIIYSSFTLGIILYQLATAGFFYQFQVPIYLVTIFDFSVPKIVLSLLGLFPMYFFDIKKNEFKTTLFIIKSLMAILLFFAFMELFYPLNYNLLHNTPFTGLVSILFIFALLVLSFQALICKKRGAVFYLFSNSIQFVFITSYILVFVGVIQYYDIYYYSILIGGIGQDLFLAMALVQATYMIKKENDKNTELLNEYSKLTFIGQTMVNISHQWKTPINSIYNSINHIEVAREFKDKNFDNILDKNLETIKNTTIFLKDTALGQLDFYKSNKGKENIKLYDEIEFLTKLIENEFSKKSINIRLDFDKKLEFTIEKNYLLNVLMVLFENSYKLFNQRNIQSPFILVEASIEKNTFNLSFQDNVKAEKDDVDKIFEKNYSLNNSTGLGLYLANEIITYKLKGKIKAENKDAGILFSISIPI